MKNNNTHNPFKSFVERSFSKKIADFLYQEFDENNKRFFFSKLPYMPINIGITPYGSAIGLYHASYDKITLHKSLFENFDDASSRQKVKDVLLHEMIHAYTRLVYLPGDFEGLGSHAGPWLIEINRIGKLLGFKCFYSSWKRRNERLGKGARKKIRKKIYVPIDVNLEGLRLASRHENKNFPEASREFETPTFPWDR